MAKPIRESLNITLQRNEQQALRAFNKEVSFMSGVCRDLQVARVGAVHSLKRKKDSVKELASAFRVLYPHWFTNGRGTLANGTMADCVKVCLDVIGKLNISSAHHFADITRLFDISGDHATPTGRRPLAHTDQGQGYKRTRTRTRAANCRYHPDKPTVAREWCTRCYTRWNTLVGKNVLIENFPGQAVEEIMNLPRPNKSNPLYKQAQEIGKKYKAMEENS